MTKLAELPTGIRRKLWDIRRTIDAVEAELAEGDDPFKYAPADVVFEEVTRQLRLKKLMVVPSLICSERRGQTTTARINIEVTDLEDEDSVDYVWEGESDNLAGAATTGLKGWYAATFAIRLKELSPDKIHERREARKRENPTVSASQINNFIGKAREESGLSDEEFGQLLKDRFDVEKLEHLPRKHADALVKLLRGYARRRPPDQQPTAEMAGVAAGSDTEPRDG